MCIRDSCYVYVHSSVWWARGNFELLYLNIVLFFAMFWSVYRRVASSAASVGPATFSTSSLLIGELKRAPPRRSSTRYGNTLRLRRTRTTSTWYVTIIIVVLTLTHRRNAVRGHRTGFNNSGVEHYLRRKNKTKNNTPEYQVCSTHNNKSYTLDKN